MSPAQSEKPLGANSAWMLPPFSCAFAEYHKVDLLILHTGGLLAEAIGREDLPVENDVAISLVLVLSS
jgi:hypothetical protein